MCFKFGYKEIEIIGFKVRFIEEEGWDLVM